MRSAFFSFRTPPFAQSNKKSHSLSASFLRMRVEFCRISSWSLFGFAPSTTFRSRWIGSATKPVYSRQPFDVGRFLKAEIIFPNLTILTLENQRKQFISWREVLTRCVVTKIVEPLEDVANLIEIERYNDVLKVIYIAIRRMNSSQTGVNGTLKPKRKKFLWSLKPEWITRLLQIMMEYVNTSMRSAQGFKDSVYQGAAQKMKEKFGIEAFPKDAAYLKIAIANYVELEIICGPKHATGEWVKSGNSQTPLGTQ
ncbi:hypothetical protein IEQ34_022643 [Dendrobium chrysotoxum]|uniref:Uncharacterized protein n=1 Tax=Dendrobium chrysotoxum TaxID=161865 RepID=A0AAV7FZG8_DENCH|nr:hypothetical protein IEQ34_022643 [Dendrobium chrysotoxum]